MPNFAPLASLRPPWIDFDSLRFALGWSNAKWLRFERWRERQFGPAAPYKRLSREARHGLWIRPGTSDLDVFHQIFLERQYGCLGEAGLEEARPVDLVIDCGANVGYSAAWFLSRFPECKVIAVEPDAGNFAQLERNLTPYGDRARIVRAAIWPRSCGLKISEIPYRDGRQWSVQVREARAGEQPDVTAVDIGSLLAQSGSSRISILKIDIEAAERFVFAENYQSWIHSFDQLAIELHDDQCRQVFFRAIDGLPLHVSHSGELTVCRRMEAASAVHWAA